MLAARAMVNLGEFGRPVPASSVPALAQSSRWGLLVGVRRDATRLLGIAPGEDAAALGDEADEVRVEAARCLGRLGPAAHLAALQRLATRETSVSVLRELVNLAVQLDAPEAPALFQTAAARLITEGSPELAAKALAHGTAPWCATYANEAAEVPPTGAP